MIEGGAGEGLRVASGSQERQSRLMVDNLPAVHSLKKGAVRTYMGNVVLHIGAGRRDDIHYALETVLVSSAEQKE